MHARHHRLIYTPIQRTIACTLQFRRGIWHLVSVRCFHRHALGPLFAVTLRKRTMARGEVPFFIVNIRTPYHEARIIEYQKWTTIHAPQLKFFMFCLISLDACKRTLLKDLSQNFADTIIFSLSKAHIVFPCLSLLKSMCVAWATSQPAMPSARCLLFDISSIRETICFGKSNASEKSAGAK